MGMDLRSLVQLLLKYHARYGLQDAETLSAATMVLSTLSLKTASLQLGAAVPPLISHTVTTCSRVV